MHADLPHLLLAHRSWLRRLARDLLHEADADDAVQETLHAALARPPRDPSVLRAWLRRVLENVAHRMRRGDRRARAREVVFAAAREGAAPSTPPEIAAQQELAATLAQAVRALDEPYRSTLHLRYHDELSPAQIAARTATALATVKTRLRRGREQLRAELDRRGGDAAWGGALVALAAPAPTTGLPGAAATPAAVGAAPAAPAGAKALTIAGCAVLAGLGLALALAPWRDGVADAPRADVRAVATAPATDSTPALATTATAADEARIDATPQDPSPRGSGVVVRLRTTTGAPVAGVRLRAIVDAATARDAGRGARGEDGRGGAANEPRRRTRVDDVRTDARGDHTIAADDGVGVQLLLADARWRFRGDAPKSAAATAPALLELTIEPVPHARIVVRAHDVATGAPLRTFRCTFHVPSHDTPWPEPGGAFHGTFDGAATDTGEIEFFAAAIGTPVRVQVDLVEPARARQRVEAQHLHEPAVVEFGVRSGPRVRGVVVDANGAPLADALVFAGGQQRARGDEPGKPFVASRVRDGVRTGADGAFAIDAPALVTAWHPDHSPRTVPATTAHRIELPPLGTVRGRLVDANGAPRAATPLRLDRTASTVTDATGVFTFTRVERGPRLVHVPGDDAESPARAQAGPWVVHAGGDDAAAVELRPGLPELRVELQGCGDATAVALVGLAAGGSLATAPLQDGAARLRNVVPGRYHLLTDRGAQLPVVVAGAELAVVSAPPAHGHAIAGPGAGAVHAVPIGADDLVRTLSARVVRVRAAADGTRRLGPLPAGDYQLFRGDEPFLEPFRVDGGDVRVGER